MEEDQFEFDVDAPLAIAFNFRKKRKLQPYSKRKKKPPGNKKENFQVSTSIVALYEEVASPIGVAEPSVDNVEEPLASPYDSILHEEVANEGPPGIRVSFFDYSIENHIKYVRTMFKLCGQHDSLDFDQDEIQNLSSSITFLKQWRDFNYKPKMIKFPCEDESMNGKNVISLPQFSAVAVPKGLHNEKSMSAQPSKDFLLYAGGSVWALDWCPRVNQHSASGMKMEFVAVAAHPPGSSYHKIGSGLSGRGVIQIWCMLDVSIEENSLSQDQKKKKRCYQKRPTDASNSSLPKRPRGRPKKLRTNDPFDNITSGNQVVDPLAKQFPGDSAPLICAETASKNTYEGDSQKNSEDVLAHVQERQKCVPTKGQTVCLNSSASTKPRGGPRRKARNEALDNVNSDSPLVEPLAIQYPGDGLPLLSIDVAPTSNREITAAESENVPSQVKMVADDINNPASTSTLIENDVPLPRMMLCLAHNGKVAWDLKWRPSNSHDKLRLGYLAVVLGSGSVEVWEVPSPSAVEVIYSSSIQSEGTDPRFIKLEPVFRCSKLNCGDTQSIPLTAEWSTSSPHDMIVAGCHDGVVALWKFSPEVSCRETKPLLRFTADTVPIRTLAWAPAESNCESSNVIVTGGNKGLKFWDIRDPFHPLWDFNPVQMNILSLNWLPDPRCLVLSFDDGTLRVLSLMKAANDLPVTGKPFTGTLQQGSSSYFCSSFAIWDVHVSQKTGMVAYCGQDGNTLRFQLTTRAVERDQLRNRVPHFLCGSLTEKDSEFTVVTPLDNTPFPMKKSLNEWGDAPRTKRGFLSVSNQKKREKEEMERNKISNEQPLALCYGDDPGGESDTYPLLARKTKQAYKGTSKAADERDLTCTNEKPETSQNEAENETDSFPSKLIAIHRVRWNMNEGSERWLCYGGAAGIIRLQKVDISSV